MSAASRHVNLGLRLLDDQLLDSNGHRCGRVDDVQLKGSPGSRRAEISALLIGPGAWSGRLRRPLSDLIVGLAPDHMHVVPWSEVSSVGTAVHLAKSATELGLETRDGRSVQWLDDPPRGTFRLSQLLRAQAVTSSGTELGRIWEVRAERRTDAPDERVNEAWRPIGLLINRGGLEERIGMSFEEDLVPGDSFVPWDAVQEFAPGLVRVAGPRTN
jgi:sporulation protein YlmC with PRC-barrel domain